MEFIQLGLLATLVICIILWTLCLLTLVYCTIFARFFGGIMMEVRFLFVLGRFDTLILIIYGLTPHFMGGIEDDEPPTKRAKASSGELRGLSNGQCPKESASSFSIMMARPLTSEGEDEILPEGFKRVEIVRIIAEALNCLGYSKTGAHLEEESGISFHSSVVSVFMQKVLDGNWDESVRLLHKIGILDEAVIKLASFVILQQKFFELLDRDMIKDALKTLRTEITPLSIDDNKIRELSSFIIAPSLDALTSSQNKIKLKSRSELLEELQRLLPPTVMIPERRLLKLVEQALQLQRDACLYHNSSVGETSLYTDHQCGRDQIPSQTLQILQEHRDEVWFLQFSKNGKYLASSSSDHSAIIWEVNVNGTVSLKHRLTGHRKPVSCVSWSPDDKQLLTCGLEEVVRRWDISSGECLHVYEKNGLGLVSCGWSPDGKWVFSGITDKSIMMWDLDGKEMDSWKGQKTRRISDLQVTSNGKMIISICKETVILLLDRESRAEKLIEEDQTIVSFVLSGDSKFLLVSLVNQEIHLWSIQGNIRLVAKYKGHKRSRFIVRACFGGLEQAFIASGSEDSQVYIWHKGSGELIETLAGHSGAVNCISWNPTNPHMLASASDDHTIRIWGLNQVSLKRKGVVTNGVHYSNGAA